MTCVYCSEGHTAIRCDYCQHVCHIAHATFCDPEDPSNVSFCCLDHLIYHRKAFDFDLRCVNVHLCEDPERIIALISSLSRRLSSIPSIAVSALVRPFPIIAIVDDFISQKSKRKTKTAHDRDSEIYESTSQSQGDTCPTLPPSFQHQPFLTALRISHLREFRIEGPDFFEGSSSIENMQEPIQREGVDDGLMLGKRTRDRHIEKSLDQCRISADCSLMYRNGVFASPKRTLVAKGERVPELQASSPKPARGELLRKKRKEMNSQTFE